MYKSIFSIFYLTVFLFSLSVYAQNGLDFDGVNDYIQTDYNGVSGNSSRTIEAWIKADDVAGQVVITDWGTFATGSRFTVALIDGKLRVEVSGSGQTGTTLLSDTTWHHIAVIYNSSLTTNKFTTYVDGVLEQNFDLSTPVNTGSSIDFRIGMRVDGVKPFKGIMDEVRIWNYARTATQISNNMNNEFCGSTTGLVAYHKLNHGIASGSNSSDTLSLDESGSANDGDLLNFSLSGSSSNWVTAQSLSIGLVDVNQTFEECVGFTIQVGNNVYSGTGIYVDTIFGGSSGGCDSVFITNLTINSPSQQSQTVVECDGYQLTVGNNVYSTTGVYVDTLVGAGVNGCDLIMTSNLTINSEIQIAQNLSICDGETIEVGGNVYSSNGIYVDTIGNSSGCDSIFTTNLTVMQDPTFTQTFEECEGFSVHVNGNNYSETGVYTDIIYGGSSMGCDSIIKTYLTIVNLIDTALIASENLLSVTYMGASYQWVDCDSNYAFIDGANGSVFEPLVNGNYAVIITDGNCIDTSSCYSIHEIGLEEGVFEMNSIISPNPINNIAFIDIGDELGISSIIVFDISGKKQFELYTIENSVEIDMSELSMGIYFVEINDGKRREFLKVMKL